MDYTSTYNNDTVNNNGTRFFYLDRRDISMWLLQSLNFYSLIPATIIIVVLMILTKRARKAKSCLCGRFGILIPVDFLGSESNRFSYVLAYGSMVVSVTNLFVDRMEGRPGREVIDINQNPWATAFGGLVQVFLVGIIYLPFFFCLSTNAKILGSLMGAFYTAFRCHIFLMISLEFPIDPTSLLPCWPLLFDAPPILLHLALFCRYLVIFVLEVRRKCCKGYTAKEICIQEEEKSIASEACFDNVKRIITGPIKSKSSESGWRRKLRFPIYKSNPGFKFSVAVLSTMLITVIIIYEMVVMIVGLTTRALLSTRNYADVIKPFFILYRGEAQAEMAYQGLLEINDIITYSLVASSITAALITYFQIYRMLVAYRNHVIKLTKGNRKFLPRILPSPTGLVGRSLEYSGYQVAYFLWAFVVTTTMFLVVTFVIAFGILVVPYAVPQYYIDCIKQKFMRDLVPVIVMLILTLMIQKFLAIFIFRDRSMDSKVINLENRRCYQLVSFFFFFFNILVGIISCSLRIVKAMVLGILFLGRIDRPFLMKGFAHFDTAYIAYIGFLQLQVAQKHPVVLVFCQLLWDKVRGEKEDNFEVKYVLKDQSEGDMKALTLEPCSPRVSSWARNRWFVAVSMIRNPTLIHDRKRYLRHVILELPRSQMQDYKQQKSVVTEV